ncbi:MAG: polysaccharide biosynthesis protein [Christensenellales bacterium]
MNCYTVDINTFNLLDAIKAVACFLAGYALYLLLNNILTVKLPIIILLNFFCINTFLFGTARLLLRAVSWFSVRIFLHQKDNAKIKNIIIFGAGGAGQYLLNLLMYAPKDRCRIVCFIDDDPKLWGRRIKGVRVLGGRENIPKAAEQYKVDEIIIAIPHVDNSTIREIFNYCALANCNIKRFANMTNFTGDSLAKATIDNVKLEDLLGRSEIKLNMVPVKEMISGKTVLITGGAGSIGSEICRQALEFGAHRIIIFDFNENGLFEIGNELSRTYAKNKYVCVLGSVRDALRLREVFVQYSPSIVFHAAAHKHVPLMEINPYEALTNNVIGTYNTATVAKEYDVHQFILISTDKAVNPTNIMGASKRIAELVIQYLSVNSKTVFSAVRFGNVLGSNGSVIPLFKRQISEGGPITVTDRNIKRYFMMIPEAVQLVLEASTMAKGREVFVLNMGEPVNIYDLACTMIRLSGLKPEKDIHIQFTGLRDGEKLFEEISLDTELVEKTQNDRIFILKTEPQDYKYIENILTKLFNIVANRLDDEVYPMVKSLVPTFCDERFDTTSVTAWHTPFSKITPMKDRVKQNAPIHIIGGEKK